MKLLSTQKLGSLYAISSGFCYGLVGYFGISIVDAGFSVSTMLFWRFFVAAIFMAILLIPQYKQLFSLDRQSTKVFLYGMLFYGTSTTFYFIASQYIGTGLAMVILFTFPAMVMIINMVVYKASIRKMYYVAFAMIVLGMTLLVKPENFSFDLYGVALGILSAFLYACYISATKHITIPPKLSTFMVAAGCMCTSLVFAIGEGDFGVPNDFVSWSNIFGMGLICTAIPILLLMQGFKYISSEKASMLSVLEPVFVVLFGILLLGEEISRGELFGIVVILSGALLTLFIENPKVLPGAELHKL